MKMQMLKKAVLLAMFAMAPFASAQNRFSIAPELGFYKADLDKIAEGLNAAEDYGYKVQRPNGGMQFGGRLNYEKSPHLTWRLEVSYWQDQAAGHYDASDGTVDMKNKIRFVPLMVGAQYYLGAPSQVRLYAGASGGIVLVQSHFEMQVRYTDPNAAPFEGRAEASGNDFIGKLFAGLEIAASPKLAFFSELGYVFGKFTEETVDADTGEKTSEDVSINGLHFKGGIKVSF